MLNPMSGVVHRSNRWRRRYSPDQFVSFETTVTKLIRTDSVSTIRAHGFMPEKYRSKTFERYYHADGTYSFEVWINHNSKTLAPFLASGLKEMDVTEVD
jgi:hypothetical protein